MRPRYQFRVLKLDLYENVESLTDALASTEFLLDMAVYVLVLKIFFTELFKYGHIRWTYGTSRPYIGNIWNMLEVMNVTPFFFSIMLRIIFLQDENRIKYSNALFVPRYMELAGTADLYVVAFFLDSISILVSFLKLFKYFRLFDATSMLWTVIQAASKDIGFFFFMLGLFLAGAVVFAEQMFGPTLKDFSTPMKCVTALLNMLLGVVDIYWEMVRTAQDKTIATLFFLGYIVWMFMIIINVFLAILNDKYGDVRGKLDEERQRKREEKEAREKLEGTPEKKAFLERVRAVRGAARGRFQKFAGRVEAMRRRKKGTPKTMSEVVAAG